MRIWQIKFQTLKALDSLPFPQEIVLEKQDQPLYHIEERCRKSGSAQIVCTLEGEGVFRHKENIYKLNPGKAFMVCSGDPDVAYYYPGYSKKNWVFLWFSFAGPQAVRVAEEMIREYGYVFDVPLDTGFVNFLQAYKTQSGSLQILTPTAGAKVVYDVLAALGETIEDKIGIVSQTQLVQSAQNIIFSNLDRTLNIALIAQKLNVTREHLTRVFHAQTGITPGQFAVRERMKAAGRMLQDNHFSCKEIAERLGYDSSSSFARAFKSYYGVSPAEYKNKPYTVSSANELTQKTENIYASAFNESMSNLLNDAQKRFNAYDPCSGFRQEKDK